SQILRAYGPRLDTTPRTSTSVVTSRSWRTSNDPAGSAADSGSPFAPESNTPTAKAANQRRKKLKQGNIMPSDKQATRPKYQPQNTKSLTENCPLSLQLSLVQIEERYF